MNFEPQKLFIGLVDFFSVLLPGAILSYLGKDFTADMLLGQQCFPLYGTENWIIFLFASYLLGHFLFLIGAMLDDLIYDPIRNMTDKKQMERLLSCRGLSPKFFRWLARVCFKKHADNAVEQVVSIKNRYLKGMGSSTKAVNAFQWCKARLANEYPGALITVNRLEADSKFFRSFIPLLLILSGAALYMLLAEASSVTRMRWLGGTAVLFLLAAICHQQKRRFDATTQTHWFILWLIFWIIYCFISLLLILFSMPPHILPDTLHNAMRWGWIGGSAILFLPFAVWRYIDQRFKSTQQAYWFILTIEAGKQPQHSLFLMEKDAEPTHAGGVVFRHGSQHIEYLLVEEKKNENHWVLPKGHIEPREDKQKAAVREVHEETGVWAEIKKKKKKRKNDEIEQAIAFDPIEYFDEGERVTVQFYLMEKVEEGKPDDRDRKHDWMSLAEAKKAATYSESKDLLDKAEKKRMEITGSKQHKENLVEK